MFGWLRPRCPVEPELKLWIERQMAWLTDRFGWDYLLARPIILPDDEFFPDLYEPTEQGVRTMLVRLCGYMGVDPAFVDLDLYSNRSAPEVESRQPEAAGLYESFEGRHAVSVEERQILDPANLTATLTHELGHVILLSQGYLHGDEPDHEPLTDLFTVFQGLGALTANAFLRDTSYHVGNLEGWSISRFGYLGHEAFGYALALFAWVRQERRGAWESALRRDIRSGFRKGRTYLERTDDSTFSRSKALRAEWLVEYPGTSEQRNKVDEDGDRDSLDEDNTREEDEAGNVPHDDAFSHGIVALSSGTYSEAVAYFTSAIEEDPEDEEAFLHRGEAHLAMGDFEDALDDACTSMELDPDDLDGVFLRGRVFFHLGDYDDAIADFEYLVQEESRGIEAIARKWRGHYWLGRVCSSRGEEKRALKEFSRAINFAPTEVEPFIHRSRLLKQMGRTGEARADRETAFRLNGEVAAREFGTECDTPG